jgi:hypothetical protein
MRIILPLYFLNHSHKDKHLFNYHQLFSHRILSHCLQRHAQEMEHQALLSIQLNKPCDVRKLMGFLKAKGTIHSIHAADIETVVLSCPWVYNN